MADTSNTPSRDLVHSTLRFIGDLVSHNRWAVLAVLISAPLLVWAGCASTTSSPTTGGSVTREALFAEATSEKAKHDAEVAALKTSLDADLRALQAKWENSSQALVADWTGLIAKYEAAEAELDRKDEQRAAVLGAIQQGLGMVPGFQTIAPLAASLFAGGLFVDNRRKDRKISSLKSGQPST